MLINSLVLKTYPENRECARCRDCGRTVHDWHTSDETFYEVIESLNGVWCWDCFCSRARKKGIRLQAEVKKC